MTKRAIAVLLFSIEMLSGQRMITTVAGGAVPDGIPALAADLGIVTGIAGGADGTLYFLDATHFRLRKIQADGSVTTVAGTGVSTVIGDGGPASAASFGSPAAAVR